ncbi:bacterial Ig-like domain protein [Methanobrevibacter cuticularis]|uniref:Bacterial Ig-like domain protein n=1 Tax=Methanobrevibacter cuticularis TaxID=47311 RepID=A0A166FCV1_9EURY|nr:Ig-like domain-containing protein [Methanobrevibacter cuticularis]KZX17545.1 bacterial Ig-like domain protein [Methanobrevibacter cuticularis]
MNYTTTQKGNITVTVSLNGHDNFTDFTNSTHFIVNKRNANLVLGSSPTVVGEAVDLIATLTDMNGNPLAGRNVTFFVNGKNVGEAVTDINGIARLSYTPSKAGKFTISAAFMGDSDYLNSTSEDNLTVSVVPEPTPTPTPTPTPDPNDNPVDTSNVSATMKKTGIPIIAIILVLLTTRNRH